MWFIPYDFIVEFRCYVLHLSFIVYIWLGRVVMAVEPAIAIECLELLTAIMVNLCNEKYLLY